jgi:hypothetical protein
MKETFKCYSQVILEEQKPTWHFSKMRRAGASRWTRLLSRAGNNSTLGGTCFRRIEVLLFHISRLQPFLEDGFFHGNMG